MATVHKITLGQRIGRTDYTAHTLVVRAYEHIKPYFSESPEEMKFIRASGKVLTSLFDQRLAQNRRRGVVHLDIWYDNMSITGEGRITLFDFDNCGNGWPVLDVGYFCMQLFYTQPDKEEYEKSGAVF
jgi:Ser/Thr protein kinase RdoA (MazF antagonist)